MKRICFFLFVLLVAFNLCALAGNIPEALLYENDAQLFFGELVSYNDEAEISYVEVIPTKAVKGDIILKSPCSIQNVIVYDETTLKSGKTYLFAVFSSLNGSEGRGHRKGSIYVFETIGTDTKTLKIKGHGNWDGDPVTRLERYLNNGDFEKAEKERLSKRENNVHLKEVTVCEFLKTDISSVEEVNIRLNEKSYILDKELFMKIAEKTVMTPVSNGKGLSFDGITITARNKDGFSSFMYITPDGSVDMYNTMFSRLPFEQYKTDVSFLKQLYAILPKEAQAVFSDFYSVNKNTYILYSAVILIFVFLFVVGLVFLKRRRNSL